MNEACLVTIAAAAAALVELRHGFRWDEIHDGISPDPIGFRFTTSSSVVGETAVIFEVFTAEYADKHPDQDILFVRTYDDWVFLAQKLSKLLRPDQELQR